MSAVMNTHKALVIAFAQVELRGSLIQNEDRRVVCVTGVGLTDKSMLLWCLWRCLAMLVMLPVEKYSTCT